MRLPRQPGRKEQRYAQLFAGMPEITEIEAEADTERERTRGPSRKERIQALREEVEGYREELAGLRKEILSVIATFN